MSLRYDSIYMYDVDNIKTLLKSTVSYLRQTKEKKRKERYQILILERNIFNA